MAEIYEAQWKLARVTPSADVLHSACDDRPPHTPVLRIRHMKLTRLTLSLTIVILVTMYMAYDICSPLWDEDEPLAFSQIVYSVGAARTVVSMVSHCTAPFWAADNNSVQCRYFFCIGSRVALSVECGSSCRRPAACSRPVLERRRLDETNTYAHVCAALSGRTL